MGCSDSHNELVDHEGILLINSRKSSYESKMYCFNLPTELLDFQVHRYKTSIIRLSLHISWEIDQRLNKQTNTLLKNNHVEFSEAQENK